MAGGTKLNPIFDAGTNQHRSKPLTHSGEINASNLIVIGLAAWRLRIVEKLKPDPGVRESFAWNPWAVILIPVICGILYVCR